MQSGPECFVIERDVEARALDIPVFHDDQHGTAIISGGRPAQCLGAWWGRRSTRSRWCSPGLGASGIACAKLLSATSGVTARELDSWCDSRGVLYEGRSAGDESSTRSRVHRASPPRAARLADALEGADAFCRSLSSRAGHPGDGPFSMAPRPDHLCHGQPGPGDLPAEQVREAIRDDAVMATGRSDYPEPGEQRPGFPLHLPRAPSTCAPPQINEAMKQAAGGGPRGAGAPRRERRDPRRSCARPTRPSPSELWTGATSFQSPSIREVLLTYVAPAVAKAAMDTGVARIQDRPRRLSRDPRRPV